MISYAALHHVQPAPRRTLHRGKPVFAPRLETALKSRAIASIVLLNIHGILSPPTAFIRKHINKHTAMIDAQTVFAMRAMGVYAEQ